MLKKQEKFFTIFSHTKNKFDNKIPLYKDKSYSLNRQYFPVAYAKFEFCYHLYIIARAYALLKYAEYMHKIHVICFLDGMYHLN